MRLLTTLLLICSTMFLRAQDGENGNAMNTDVVETVNAVASEIEKAEAVNVYID